jgi:hypothetical protein
MQFAFYTSNENTSVEKDKSVLWTIFQPKSPFHNKAEHDGKTINIK